MIQAAADFREAEDREVLRPEFGFYLSPYYFPTGIGEGSGTFTNCTFVSPGKILVTYGSLSASWLSPVQTNKAAVLPATVTPTWAVSLAGYVFAAEYRTSNNEDQVADLPWTAATNGTDVVLYHYYQFRFTWTSIRAWFCDTEADAIALSSSFWFIDSLPSDYASYFCEGTLTSYLDVFRLAGEYQINSDDIADSGELVESMSPEFGQLVAGDHSMELINRDNKFTPGHDNFIFDDSFWYRKRLRIAMWYIDRGVRTSEIDIWQGIVTEWGPRQEKIDPDGQVNEPTITISGKNLVLQLLERRIGVPLEDGTPNPWCCGEFLQEARQLGDESPYPASKSIDMETGDTSEFSMLDVYGSGSSFSASSTYAKGGTYSAKAIITAANGRACGNITHLPSSKILFSAWVMVPSVPATLLHRNTCFMGLLDNVNNRDFRLFIGDDYKVWLAYYGPGPDNTWYETSWKINEDVGTWKRVSIGFCGLVDGVVKVFVNGDEVLSQEGDWSSAAGIKGGFIGLTQAAAESWTFYYDEPTIYPGFEKFMYRIDGYPFKEIRTVYQDGAIRQEIKKKAGGTGDQWSDLTKVFIAGSPASDDTLIVKKPELGVIIFLDPSNHPTGTVFARVRKDDRIHPADVLSAMASEVGLGTNVDPVTFAAYKTSLPSDSIGCYFEDTTVGEAMRAVAEPCLLNLLAPANLIKLLAYQGTAENNAPVAWIDNWAGFEQSVDMSNIKSRVRYKYGWYDRNKLLFYKAVDEDALRLLTWPIWQENPDLTAEQLEPYGQDLDFDLSWGNPVGSDNSSMAKDKADWLLNRYRAGWEMLSEVVVPFTHARVECGDTVQMRAESLNNAYYQVLEKRMKLSHEFELSFSMGRFLGENQPGPYFEEGYFEEGYFG